MSHNVGIVLARCLVCIVLDGTRHIVLVEWFLHMSRMWFLTLSRRTLILGEYSLKGWVNILDASSWDVEYLFAALMMFCLTVRSPMSTFVDNGVIKT